MQYDICLKTTSEAALVASLAPFGLTAENMGGQTVLKTGGPGHALAYFGRVVATPAMIDPVTMAVTTDATYHDGEYAILRAEEALLNQVMAAALDGVEVLADPPSGCPTFGGGWRVLSPGNVLSRQQEACARIDAHAESLCNQVITPGSAQMARYQRKESQARAYLAALEAGTLLADADVLSATYPAVIGEVGITAETPESVARVIVAMADAWWAYGDAVEAARLAGKRAVEAAGTPEAVAAAEAAIVWPAAPQ